MSTKLLQAFSAHTLLLCFTILLVLKLDQIVSYSWWIIFLPLFLFHAIVARGRFSLPGSLVSHGRYVPFLVVFELLLCVFLERTYAKKSTIISLKIVFLPLLAFELTVLVHNLRICKDLFSGVHGFVINDPTCEILRHVCVSISMGFFVAGTVFTLRKLSGDISSLSWWELYICFGIAECFVFLACTNWSNVVIHRNSHISSSSTTIRYYDWITCLVGSTEDNMCGLQDIHGHIMKLSIMIFQILLCMRLEGKPAAAGFIPLSVVFSPIFLVQGFGFLFAAFSLIILLCGSRQSIHRPTGDRSRGEQARVRYNESSGYNTFSRRPPETVKRLPNKDQTEKVRKLLEALKKQKEITSTSQQTNEKLDNETILCKICFERDINTVLLPCGHHCLCRICSDQCQKCPFCRAIIEVRQRSPIHAV